MAQWLNNMGEDILGSAMAWQVEVLASNSYNLTLIPRTQIMEGEKQFLQVVF